MKKWHKWLLIVGAAILIACWYFYESPEDKDVRKHAKVYFEKCYGGDPTEIPMNKSRYTQCMVQAQIYMIQYRYSTYGTSGYVVNGK